MSMEVIKRTDLFKLVSKRWDKIYAEYSNADKLLKGNRLRKNKSLDRETIDSIIGNSTWTTNRCDVCQGDCDTIISIQSFNKDEIDICESCLEKALKKIGETK